MKSRREFLQLAGRTAVAAAATRGSHSTAQSPDHTSRTLMHGGENLLALQQIFVDLRFGMFLHFNMATFQDREWGDPRSQPDLFHPTALDKDDLGLPHDAASRRFLPLAHKDTCQQRRSHSA